jgi:hypothetical protein
VRATFRPLPLWPYKPTENRRSIGTFKAAWSDTLDLVEYEIGLLAGADIIIAGAFREEDIRLDGMMRSTARVPEHPGIEISFDSAHGRLVYASDVCDFWQHNVRSIGLGLEALRAVNRYGISRKGEQYAGWLQLGWANEPIQLGRTLVEVAGGMHQALKAHHPDYGGERANYEAVIAYRRSLEGARS